MSQPISKSKIVFFDTETTGLDDDAEIVQVGIIDIDGNVLLDTLVQCQGDIPVEATNIHGITKDMLTDAPTWPEVHDNVMKLLAGDDVVVEIYNSTYDMRMLRQTASRYDLELKDIRSECVMKRYANAHMDGNWVKLTEAAFYCQIDTSNIQAHNAVGDCEMTRQVYLQLERELKNVAKMRAYREASRLRKMELVPANEDDYPYFGQSERPEGYKTMSKLAMRDLDKYEFAGTCCNSFGDRGYLFKPKKGI